MNLSRPEDVQSAPAFGLSLARHYHKHGFTEGHFFIIPRNTQEELGLRKSALRATIKVTAKEIIHVLEY